MKTEISTYEQQAIDFLTATTTTFKAEFLKHGKHFDNDKETRDIYKITLQRGNRVYFFNFGQSINESGIQIVNRNNGKTMKTFAPSKQYEKNDKFDLMRFKFVCGWQFASCDQIILPKAPGAYNVLACLIKYDIGTFEDFCSEFGYDNDSRQAENTYKAVLDEYKNVCMLWNESEIEQLKEIQ